MSSNLLDFAKNSRDSYIKQRFIFDASNSSSRFFHTHLWGDRAWFHIIINSNSISLWKERTEHEIATLVCRDVTIKDQKHFDRIKFAASLLTVEDSPILKERAIKSLRLKEGDA